MMFKLGLTGSIGMGKSTTTKMFADAGCATWDADEAVHRLYARGGAAVGPLSDVLPNVVVDGAISRQHLKLEIDADKTVLKRIENIVHPLVARDREAFLEGVTQDICVLDIPLLFETGGDKYMDAVVCVTAPPDVQRQRVLDRGTMTEAQFNTILSKQMPDAEKRSRSDYVIETVTLEKTRKQVHAVIEDIRAKLSHA